MKKSFTITLLIFCFFSFAQQRQFTINWNGHVNLEAGYAKLEIPSFDSNHFSYSQDNGLIYFAEWKESTLINESSASLSNVTYSDISKTELKDLDLSKLTSEFKVKLVNVQARGKRSVYLEINPIIKDGNIYKRLNQFTVNYSSGTLNRQSTSSVFSAVSNSVLASGQWYRFYVDTTGVYRLSKSFLSRLGVNVNGINPRELKVFGNGGEMLPYLNSANSIIDLQENAIQFVGEEDGRFDDNDYILFYAKGPQGFNQEQNTNINLYTDKTYYYVNISGGNGKRINELSQPDAAADIIIDTFQDYDFYEVDEFNLVKLGRRWFGDRFDVETQRNYEFKIPNIDSSVPVNIRIVFGSVSELPSSMTVSINGSNTTNVGLPAINPDGFLFATGANFFNAMNLSSEDLDISLEYDNGGNPVASAYLDYITIEATRRLQYANEQLFFKNNSVASTSGVVQYNLSNAAGVNQIWDVTDIFNVRHVINENQSSEFNFKTNAGELRHYVAFSNTDFLEPQRDAITQISNQNLKGTVLTDNQGQFQDVDYLLITPQLFLDQAERLAAINRFHNNLTVKVVTLQDIYNEFSSGNQDIAAIRNFVRYVYNNASSPDKRVKYVGLFGDASYDYKDRLRNNTNFVPSWFSLNSFSVTGSLISDDFYGIMDDNEGTLATFNRLDIAVGRMLVDSPQRAKEVVDKIEAYYAEDSYGSWRNNILLVSDDVDEPFERVLQQTTDDVATDVRAQKPFLNSIKVHTDAFQQLSSSGGDRYPEVNDAFRNAIDVGVLLVNYFGHGGELGLAEERIFDINDSQSLNNNCRFNCFVTVTCEYTKYDNPDLQTAGEYTYWNTKGGAIGLITTTRQIFVTVGTDYNEVLEDYLFAYGSNDYPSMAEALRLTKLDPQIAGSSQKRLVHFIGDPAMKLAIPRPSIRLTHINDTPITQTTDVLEALGRVKLSGEVVDESGNLIPNYNGILTATVFDKDIERRTLANDNTSDANGLIVLEFTTLGEIIFKGQATIQNGQFEFNFVVPRDIGIPIGQGKVSFYAKRNNVLEDQTGHSFDIQVGGINENAEEDNIGPVVNLFMNDENFVSGGITNESPTLLAKLQDDNGINTASGIGHDITAILDGDETNPFVLNDYYQAEVDDYTRGTVTFAFRDLEPGLHTLTLKAWDVYNNSSTSEIQFEVFNNNEELVINNVLNYPNPFVDYTEFWFNHNSSDVLDISVQIFTISGKLVKTLNGQTNTSGKSTSTLSRDIVWDGLDDFGDKIGKGTYIYKLKVKSQRLNKQIEKIQKLVILQ
ncbi:putative secreted protein (Por secretion system target) [Winogradskyella wandonensis]|uniref:Putative secreted protein (Por secretion system target) n=1 Tax=Winogradskyella wandonensis TaxID=1442586 RepID=A0A4R1KTK3_9FLAO|nr:type IX secretion system sortase PorU [Winogradskyella wandonensis]TCK68506.1 putative secreted protein (Por secretion system target) [Winogradskyella wandonensis]